MTFIPWHFPRPTIFKDRIAAGKKLAERLEKYNQENTIVLGLARGGVVVANEVARQLQRPLDVIVTRKIAAPYDPEFGVGALSEEGVLFLDRDTVHVKSISDEVIDQTIQQETGELNRRIAMYRNNRQLDVLKKQVILVDDGLATGVTALAAVGSLHKLEAARIIFASPICAYEKAQTLRARVDALVCIESPYDMQAISLYYEHFPQVTDQEVLRIIKQQKLIH